MAVFAPIANFSGQLIHRKKLCFGTARLFQNSSHNEDFSLRLLLNTQSSILLKMILDSVKNHHSDICPKLDLFPTTRRFRELHFFFYDKYVSCGAFCVTVAKSIVDRFAGALLATI
jgi:hypothetical protein